MSHRLTGTGFQRVFRYCAWVVTAVGIFVLLMPTPLFDAVRNTAAGDAALRVMGAVLGIMGAPAALIIWFGMLIFLFQEDRSTRGTKVLWFIVFFLTACFGSTAYFFSVYRKQIEQPC